MKKESTQKIWLGIFVLTGLIFLSVILYLLGDRQNFFDRTIRIHVLFSDVSGLRPGNNVRLSGINIGTVEETEIVNDSLVGVTMVVEAYLQPYIKKNATASVGTDGLMGNRVVLIHPGKMGVPENRKYIEEGDTLREELQLELTDMLAVLENTNANISVVAADLVTIIHKISSGEGSLGKLISDSSIAIGLEEAIESLRSFPEEGVEVLNELKTTVSRINQGQGLATALLSDTAMVRNLSETLTNLENTTKEISMMGQDLREILGQIQSGEGSAGALLTNPELAQNIELALENIRIGSSQFNEVMEALKHNILLRRYFKKKKKGKQEESNETNPY